MSAGEFLKQEWTALEAELDRWAEAGRVASFWWRDDDATEITPGLDRLLQLRRSAGVPLTLAVIPKPATQALADRLNGLADVAVVQHGYAHLNHAPLGDKKSEFPSTRALQHRLEDLRAGAEILRRLFPKHLPVLVPPWNRIAEMPADLASLGFIALSGFKLRQQPYAAPGLVQLNTHIDPVDWRGGDVSSGFRTALTTSIYLLQLLRANAALQQPLGLLTHHLRHDEIGWDFVAKLIELVGRHPGACWIGLEQALTVGLPRDGAV